MTTKPLEQKNSDIFRNAAWVDGHKHQLPGYSLTEQGPNPSDLRYVAFLSAATTGGALADMQKALRIKEAVAAWVEDGIEPEPGLVK